MDEAKEGPPKLCASLGNMMKIDERVSNSRERIMYISVPCNCKSA